MNISVHTAARLFIEANDWTTGQVPYITDDSEIRRIAKTAFDGTTLLHLNAVCNEIFRILAVEYARYYL
jgi:hypothetical protein